MIVLYFAYPFVYLTYCNSCDRGYQRYQDTYLSSLRLYLVSILKLAYYLTAILNDTDIYLFLKYTVWTHTIIHRHI